MNSKMDNNQFSLNEKYILRYAIEDLLDKKDPRGGYQIGEIKTVWDKILKSIDSHDNPTQ